MNTSLKKIPIPTYFLPQQIQDPNCMKQEVESHSTGFTSWCQKESGANNQEPKR